MMAAEMLMNMDDIVFLVYVDEASGEIEKYEMDLSALMQNMMKSISESFEVPEEELEMLESLKMYIEMKMSNINEAEDFEIPEEALNAPLVEDIVPVEE